ncbi:MAG TPA: exodeoxyribonuclease VII large subunit, partial [Rheinheimera sp.]|nr:exodeoxyribonuclease VII large subunit [Rheinheimera sp.]
QLQQRLKQAQQRQLKQHTLRLAQLSSQLNTVSPLATLARGYSITFDEKQNVVTSIAQVSQDQAISVRLADGTLSAKVLTTQPTQSE